MIGNLVVGAVVVLLIVAAVACLIRQKRKGIGCCGCSGCSSSAHHWLKSNTIAASPGV